MRQLIAGNWKMNGRLADVEPYAAALRQAATAVDLVVCPPFLLLQRMVAALAGHAAVGAQDCHALPAGAYTGDTAADNIREIGASHVILGHSERRAFHGETNADIAAKARAAIAAGLIPIVCVGETAAERDSGQAEDLVRSQLTHSLPADFAGVVAYEPIWAIGTGRTPAPEEIAAMHACIRQTLRQHIPATGAATGAVTGAVTRILYGGSVKPGNAAAILALPEVGGALVGGACLSAADFLAIAAGAPGL